MEPAFVVGGRYRVTHRSDAQRFNRVSVMDYLGESGSDYVFNARPVAGTQTMPQAWLIDAELVRKDTPIVLNKRDSR
jgi:hypothetical protein